MSALWARRFNTVITDSTSWWEKCFLSVHKFLWCVTFYIFHTTSLLLFGGSRESIADVSFNVLLSNWIIGLDVDKCSSGR